MDNCWRCGGERWVCEEHRDLPFHHDDCGGAGEPCPECNNDRPPAMPDDFEIHCQVDHHEEREIGMKEHTHSAWKCPTHVRNCECEDPDNMICNPYYENGYCPDDLNWLPQDEPATNAE